MIHTGFDDVRIVGGTGDQGADIVGSYGGKLWIVQCKFTTASLAPVAAIAEVVNAGRVYGADVLTVATSQNAPSSFIEELRRYERDALTIHHWNPQALLDQMALVPEYAPSRRTLRAYQNEAKDCAVAALTETGRAFVVLATGLGKSVIVAETVADLVREGLLEHDRVLVLAHTKELVRQLHRTFWYHLPKWIPTHQMSEGEFPTFWDGITFATVQSVVGRLDRIELQFDLVIIDEAHHAASSTYASVIESIGAPKIMGVTATPWRGDTFDVEAVFGQPVFQMDISEGIAKGFLAEVDYRLMADNIDWHVVQEQSQKRYSLKQLNTRLILPTRDAEAARIIQRIWKETNRCGGILFTRSIEHAHEMAGTLRLFGLTAEAISGDMPPREQELLMSRFRSGKLEIVCSVDLFNEGVDVPDVDLIVFMRVTHSRRIFVQQLGRGLRLAASKDKVIVLDFVTDLRRVADVLNLDKAVREGGLERLGLGGQVVDFADASAGSFLHEWVMDQASLKAREGEADLDVPDFSEELLKFPMQHRAGTVQ